MPGSDAKLQLEEAVELGHAWVQALADAHSIRVLFIKGPSFQRHRLRERRSSSDVDLLVEPARFTDLCSAIQLAGWSTRPSLLLDRLGTTHSTTFFRDDWPCDLDVHDHYPGFLAKPTDVFETLWSRRVTMPLANRPCGVQDRASGVLILALHSLRGADSEHDVEFRRLFSIPYSAAERAEMAWVAQHTGCAATLGETLARIGVAVHPTEEELTSGGLKSWRQRVAAGPQGVYPWLRALRLAPWRDRPRIVARSLWPTRHDLLLANPATIDTLLGRARARIARWARGARSVPAVVRAVWRYR